MPNLLTAEQLADALGMDPPPHPRTLQRWHAQGIIPAEISEGRYIRFDLEEVKAALKKRAAKKGKATK